METLLQKHKSNFADIPSLYDYQVDVLRLLQQKKNTLAIIPTGGGKSLLYQLMALELEGITIVVSPLLALMEEQVNELNEVRKIRSLALNSQYSFVEQRDILRNFKSRNYKLVYVSPERLQNPFFRAALIASGAKVSMIVVDEAHCISQWGSNFRPEYSQIQGFVQFLKNNAQNPFLFCLTATLSKSARQDIIKEFNIYSESIFIANSIIRDNLILHFEKVGSEKEKPEKLYWFLQKNKPKKTLVYLYSRFQCKEYAKIFHDKYGYTTDYYHSSVETKNKTEVFNKFLNNEIDILFATTAFGMGVNIPDIECVAHIHIPFSIEEYYQHVGRGWRKKTEKKDCNCLVIWSDKNFEERHRELNNQIVTDDYVLKGFKALVGIQKKKIDGAVVSKDKDVLMNSELNLQLLRYKLEKQGIISTVGELNGSPLTIELKANTELWERIINVVKDGIDSFVYACNTLSINISEIIEHLYDQDLKNNIKKLPAMNKDIYFKVNTWIIPIDIRNIIVQEINEDVQFRIERVKELNDLFLAEYTESMIENTLK